VTERLRRRTGTTIVMERPDGVRFFRELRDGENGAQVLGWLLDAFGEPKTWTWSVRPPSGAAGG
jgi:hypothetical protein